MRTFFRKFSFLNIGAITIIALSLFWGTGKVLGWTLNFTDTFNRADSATLGNNWDLGAGTYTIVSNQAVVTTAGNPWVEGVSMRPAGESTTDQRITFRIPAGEDVSGDSFWLSPRTHSRGTEYIIGLDHAETRFGKSVGGSLSFLGSTVAISGYNSSHSYLVDASVEGTSPTTLSITVTDETTDTVVATNTTTDSTSELQSAGVPGFFTVGTITFDDFKVYDTTTPPASSYTFTGPTGTQVSVASSNYTITPDGLYTGTITPSDNGAGGTFTPSSLTFSNSSTAQTFTYTPASTGTKTLSVSASPTLGTNPASISVVVTTLPPGEVRVNNAELIWSPYNWKFNGSTWAQTTPGGAYVKVGFTGSTLALGVSTSTMDGIDLGDVVVNAYIDGSASPVSKTLEDLSATGLLTFSSGLSSGSHYAIIYLSHTLESADRWSVPANVLRITKIQLATDGTGAVASLASTPLAEKSRKIIIFGDSITEGVGTSGAEYAYSAILAETLDVEYGQIGYGAVGWDVSGNGGVPPFYDSSTPANSSWRHFYSGTTRLTNNSDLSAGFAGGVPNALFLNMGTNDYLNTTNTTNVRTKVASFLADARTTVGSWPAIFVISPFRFGNADASAYKTALLNGLADYQSAHPSDTRVYLLDLGSDGYATTNAHGGLHPDDTGSEILGEELAALAEDYIIDPVTEVSSVSVSLTSNSVTATWNTDAVASSILDFGLTSTYASSTTEIHNATTTRTTTHSVTLANLSLCTRYHYSVRSRDLGLNSVSSADNTFTTEGCPGSAEILSSSSAEITGSGTVTNGDTTLTIPNDFSETYSNASFQANELNATTFFVTAGTPSGKTAVGNYVVELKALGDDGSAITTFDTPLTVTMGYEPGDVSGLDTSSLTIYRYDSGTWTALTNCSVNTTAHTVSCQTSHFSSFSIFGQTASSGGGSSGSRGGGGTHYGCKDPAALNYEFFAASRPGLCLYAHGPATIASTATSTNYAFTRDLRISMTGIDVFELQKFLVSQKIGVAAQALAQHGLTKNFGPLTQKALIEFQKANAITPAVGYFGPVTRAKVKLLGTKSAQ